MCGANKIYALYPTAISVVAKVLGRAKNFRSSRPSITSNFNLMYVDEFHALSIETCSNR